MDTLEDLYKLSKLLVQLNKSGLDVELLQIGKSQLSTLSIEESQLLESEVEHIKDKINEHKLISEDYTTSSDEANPASKQVVRGYVDGCYDLMHAGHYNSLRQASKLCDHLVSGVNSDNEIEKCKGPTIFKGDERAALVRACKWVDEVACDTEYTPTEETLDRYNCAFFMHGDDVSINENGEDIASRLRRAGKFKLFKRTRGVSTTDLAAKLIKIHDALTLAEGDKDKLESDIATISASEPKKFSSFHVNPDFLASARRIAQFANTKDPEETDKIVYLDGCFDLFRPGHVEILREAKQLGDYLIVGIHDDEVSNQYLGKFYPLSTLHERVLSLLACRYVDDVIIGAPFKITENMIRDLSISVVVKSFESTKGMHTEEAEAFKPYEVSDQFIKLI